MRGGGGSLRVRATKRYFTDGRVLVGSPRSGGAVMTYPDGSYLCGRFEEGEAEGYCVYRDIAGRLIYTGYMENTSYQGWGAIWNETGEWPEHITFWCSSYPGNRVLRIKNPAGERCQWVSYRDDEPSPMGEPVTMTAGCKQLFRTARNIASSGTEMNETQFAEIIKLYTDARVAADRFTTIPPSPHHGPHSRADAVLSPLRLSPVVESVDSGEVVRVRNPLSMFRVPPRIV
jgi:hypothetical protein